MKPKPKIYDGYQGSTIIKVFPYQIAIKLIQRLA